MNQSIVRKIGVATVALGLTLACTACSARKPAAAADAWREQQLTDLAKLPAPKGVSEATWSQLKDTLRKAILAHPRSASAAPTTLNSAAQLTNDGTNLTWGYSLAGDYDQNGVVNISDLTPLGVHFGEGAGSGPFGYTTIQSVIDADGNGLINIADITSIGANFGKKVSQYNVYQSASASDYPASPSAADTVSPAGAAPLTSATGAKNTDRLSFSFPLPAGGGNFWVRAADGSSVGTPSNLVTGTSGPPALPVPSFTADTLSGDAPLTVNFDASASTGGNGDFYWDWDGDGAIDFSTFSGPTASNTFSTPGRYPVTLTLNNNVGSASTVVNIVVTGPGNLLPPIAALTATPNTGTAPLTVTLDASGSSGPGGSLVSADFTTRNDGAYDITGIAFPAASTQTTYTIDEPGIYSVKVKVTDSNGLTNTAGVTVQVFGSWTLVTDVSPDYPDGNSGSEHLAIVAGKPAIAYEGGATSTIAYKSALDALGDTWNPATIVDYSDWAFGFESAALLEIDGKPALAYALQYDLSQSTPATKVFFRRALDAAGTQWEPRKELLDVGENHAEFITLQMVNGVPIIAFACADLGGLVLLRAQDAHGDAWGGRQDVADSADFVGGMVMGLVDGNPVLLYKYANTPDWYFLRATNADGTAWGTPLSLNSSVGDPNLDYVALAVIAGNPAISYYNRSARDTHYCRALDVDGATWGTQVAIPGSSERFGGPLVEFNGRPLIVYNDGKKDIVAPRMLEEFSSYGSDASGTAWDTVPVETHGYDGPPSLLVSGGVPMIAYDGQGLGGLRFGRMQ